MRVKKVALFIPFGLDIPGGAERVVLQIANELVRRDNIDVSIISYQKTDPFYYAEKNLKFYDLSLVQSSNYFLKKVKPILYFYKFRNMIKERKVDYVISVGEVGTIFMILSTLYMKNIKKISWIHNSFFQPSYKTIGYLRNLLFHLLDKIVVLNKTDMKEYKRLFGKKVVTIPNPVSFKLEGNSSLNNKKLISVGRYAPVKGFNYLIEAMELVIKKFPDVNLNIFGYDEGEKMKLENLITRKNLQKNIVLYDSISNIENEYLKADIFIMTSLYECFPMVLLEAKEAGLPIISFDCNSGPRDIVNDLEDGYLVEYLNIVKLSEKIIELLQDDEKRCKFGIKAKENVKEYHIENIIHKWEDLLGGM